MMRLLLLLLALMLGSCAHHDDRLSLGRVEIAAVEQSGDDVPAQITLRAEVQNRGAKFSVRAARLRVGIGSRRSVAFSLVEPVKVVRGSSVVEVPIKITVAHNSRSMALRQALRQRKWSLIEFDGEFKLRRGLATRTESLNSEEFREMLSAELWERVWNFIDENINDEH